MYTVIIAEQEHIDNVHTYALFLEPFIKGKEFALCQWNPEEIDSLNKAVPDLMKTVANKAEWRAIIVCDEKGLNKKNPFDIINYQPPVYDEENQSLQEYYEQRFEYKKAKYDAAAQEPLVRLVTRLCEDPTITSQGDLTTKNDAILHQLYWSVDEENEPTREDLEYKEYRACTFYKNKLRKQIRGQEPLVSSCPKEIICVAKRHNIDYDYELQSIWSKHDEREYSRFYDWNLYFDKMRYIVFDLEEKGKMNYTYDYIRFMIGVALLAGNEVPTGSLQSQRVYNLRCDMDVEVMKELLGRYNAKISSTMDVLNAKIGEIRSRQVERLSDNSAEKIFSANIRIPILITDEFDRETLFCKEKIGLSKDCPADDEEIVWGNSCVKNKKAIRKFLKLPRRSIKKGADKFKQMNEVIDQRAVLLNEFQLDDLKEHINQEELLMAGVYIRDIFDTEDYIQKVEKEQEKVQRIINQRMRKKIAIITSSVVMTLAFICMMPAFIVNHASLNTIVWAVILTLGTLLMIAGMALVCLFVFRMQLKQYISDYNGAMGDIIKGIEGSLDQYSAYMSHACNVMRGNSVLNYYENHTNGDAQEIKILRMHVSDMKEQKSVLMDIFGRFISQYGEMESYDELPYEYDFSRAVTYDYALPKASHLRKRIEFLQIGNYVEIPYGIVESVKLKREELYD